MTSLSYPITSPGPLLRSFAIAALYSAMPDAQKKIADGVFRAAHQTASAHG